MLVNIKILESLFTKSPREAEEYLTYLKFLVIKGTRFQSKAILAFDQDYRATKARENYSWGSNLDDLSAQYFDATVAQRPSRASDNRGESRVSSREEFCFRWNFNPNGCPNPQSCRYKHACIHCSSDKHKGKSCTGAASPVAGKKLTVLDSTQAPLEVSKSSLSPLDDCPLCFHAWKNKLASDPDKDFILEGLCNGFKRIPESDTSCIDDYELDNYSSATCPEFKPEMDLLF